MSTFWAWSKSGPAALMQADSADEVARRYAATYGHTGFVYVAQDVRRFSSSVVVREEPDDESAEAGMN